MTITTEHLTKKSSGVHGLGVFTSRAIAAGEPVIRVVGREVRAEEVTPDMRVMQIGRELYLAEAQGCDDLDSYINHSCEPNVGFLHGDLVLHALRDIAAGEELFWDYSTSIDDGWEVPCSCGAPHCRGKIQSFSNLDPEHRRRLGAIALQYLRV